MLDDLNSRTGSAASLLLTVVGLYLRRVGGWMSTASLVRLTREAGSSDPLTRTAITRLKQRRVLVSETRDGAPGYGLQREAIEMFERGDRRIFAPRNMTVGDAWCLVSFSIPEEHRHVRHQLRRRLVGIGCGLVASALWICPDYLRHEVEEILVHLGVRSDATLFRTEDPSVAGSINEAIATWWDLGALDALHRQFIAAVSGLLPVEDGLDAADAFHRYVIGMDAWRNIPYLDPGLPFEFLPPDWPGRVSIQLFRTLSECTAESAWRHVADVVSGGSSEPRAAAVVP